MSSDFQLLDWPSQPQDTLKASRLRRALARWWQEWAGIFVALALIAFSLGCWAAVYLAFGWEGLGLAVASLIVGFLVLLARLRP
jgi:hypothetical protein